LPSHCSEGSRLPVKSLGKARDTLVERKFRVKIRA